MIDLSTCQNLEALGLLLQNEKLIIKKTVEEPIWIKHVQKVEIEKGVFVQLVEDASNSEIEILALEDSKVEYQVLSSHSTNRTIRCYGDFHLVEISLASTQEVLQIDILKEGISIRVELLAIANQNQQTFVQRINHLRKATNSNISNFGVAMNHSKTIFDTTGKIEKGMSQSQCVQLSKGIVMDDTSSITSKPILLIDEYDVIANHGASIGKMSDEILFYLMSRGLSKTDAFLLILEGIISPFVNQIKSDELQKKIKEQVKYLTMG